VANQMVVYDGRAGAWAAIQETIAELITEEGSA
jgi:hypothetical protein